MILSVLLGIAAIVAAVMFGQQGTDMVEALAAPVTLSVEKFFTILGAAAPLLVAIIPVYVALKKSEANDKTLAYAALYGLGLYGLALYTGLDSLLLQEMRSSYVGSALDMAVEAVGPVAEWLSSLAMGLALWGAGLALTILDAVLDALVGIGYAAQYGRGRVDKARRRVLRRLAQ